LLAATALRLQSPQRCLVDISGNRVTKSTNGITARVYAGCTFFFGRALMPVESAHTLTSVFDQVLAGHTIVTTGWVEAVPPTTPAVDFVPLNVPGGV